MPVGQGDPVIDCISKGIFKVLGKGELPTQPLVVKAQILLQGRGEEDQVVGGACVLERHLRRRVFFRIHFVRLYREDTGQRRSGRRRHANARLEIEKQQKYDDLHLSVYSAPG